MEKYILDIEYINKYINKSLSINENEEFTNRLQKDFDFNVLYNQHLIFLEGLKRVKIKQEIQSAYKSYIMTKWVQFGSISIAIIFASVIIYSVFTNKADKQKEQLPSIDNLSVITSDSTIVDESSKIQFKTNNTSRIEANKNADKVKEEKINKPITNIVDVLIEKEIVEEIFEETLKEPQTETSQDKLIISKSTIDYESFKKSPQKLVVDVEKDVIITCDEGTKLSIKKHSFIDAVTNKLVRGKVDLKVTEYYKLSDMILGDLTTTSDGKLLETGGMLYIKATKNNRELKLKSDKSIEISFPKKKDKKGMQLFRGIEEKDGINWVLNENELIEEDIEVPFSVIENVPIYPGCENGNNQQRRDCMSRSLQELVNREFNTNLAVGLGLKGLQKINVVFKIDKNGLITGVRSRAPHPVLEAEVERVIKLLLPMKPGRQRGRSVIVPYSLPIVFKIENDNANIIIGNLRVPKIQDSISFLKITDIEKIFERKAPSNVSNSELNWYVFRSLELGWINCDRFLRSRRPMIKLRFKIKNAKDSDVKLVFKERNSILRGRKKTYDIYDFGSVPKNEDVVLIAIKKSEDKFSLAIENGKTDTISEIELDFKEMTIQELKAEIETLKLVF